MDGSGAVADIGGGRVYISYAWGGDSERVADALDTALGARGIVVVRDKRDLGYRGAIRGFMEEIGRGHAVVLVISDEYLKSSNCMFELVEIARHTNSDMRDRIYPVVLHDADIYDPVNRIRYIKHWEDKSRALAEAMMTVNPANLQGIREDVDLYDAIRDHIAGLTSMLSDMNVLTPEMHSNSDFAELVTQLERALGGSPPIATARADDGQRPSDSAPLVSFVEGVVAAVVTAGNNFAIIAVGKTERYVQIASDPSGQLTAEVSSNVYLKAQDRWSDAQLAELVVLGWHPPTDTNGSGNHFIDWSDTSGPDGRTVIARAANLIATTFARVFGVSTPAGLSVTMEEF